jgi:DUF1680 family protein
MRPAPSPVSAEAVRPARWLRGLRPAPAGAVSIDDAFWAPRLRTLREATVRTVLDHFEQPSGGAYRNFDRVRDKATGGHTGFPWYDGLVYETITGASRFLLTAPDPELDARLDGYIARIAAAQAAGGDGYLATYTMLVAPDKRWGENGGNLRWQHDVYNAGCLVEAGVAHYLATGKRSLLDVAVRLARHLCDTMGKPPRKNIVPAHPLPEYALVDLYRLLADRPELRAAYPWLRPRELLRLAQFWIDARGNHRGRTSYVPRLQAYAQDHEPLLRQKEAVGHAVRATLLYAGLAAVGREAGRRRYLRAARRLWDDVVTTKMHVTGGVGALQEEEMFGPAYYLPHEAYLETCAGVGMALWSHGMALAFPDGEHADVFEQALYNNVLAGVSLDGTRFFYRNPLVSRGDHHRWEWHPCPCCPPMLLKLVADLGRRAYSLGRRSVVVDHYLAGTAGLPVAGAVVTMRQTTRYPWDGKVELAVDPTAPLRFALLLRIPGWCTKHSVAVNGVPAAPKADARSGYLALERRWSRGDTVTLALSMPVTLVEANPYVEACRGRVAIRRGPLVYCLEEADNGPDLHAIILSPKAKFKADWEPDTLGGAVVVRGDAVRIVSPRRTEEPYDSILPETEPTTVTAVPYCLWCNRKPGEMSVWIRCGD